MNRNVLISASLGFIGDRGHEQFEKEFMCDQIIEHDVIVVERGDQPKFLIKENGYKKAKRKKGRRQKDWEF